MPVRSPLTSVTAALSMATSVPVPIAIPTSAAARAGASLIPSPAMATRRPSSRRLLTPSPVCLPAAPLQCTSSIPPTCSATASAVIRLSPVIMTSRTPALRSALTALAATFLDRIGDAQQARKLCRQSPTNITPWPFDAQYASALSSQRSPESAPLSSKKALVADGDLAARQPFPVITLARDARRNLLTVGMLDAAFLRAVDDGLRQRMFATLLESCSQRKEFALIEPGPARHTLD